MLNKSYVNPVSKTLLYTDFDRIYVSYYPRMIRFARNYVVCDEEAENLVQDVFVLLWEKREVLTIQVSLLAYLLIFLINSRPAYPRHLVVTEDGTPDLLYHLT